MSDEKSEKDLEIQAKETQIKAQYGEVFKAIVHVSEEDKAIGYFKKPSRSILGAVFSKIERNPVGALEIMMKNCIIEEHSDPRIMENDSIFISAMSQMQHLLDFKQAELKKL